MSDKFRGINQIEVDGYKSIRNLTVDFKAITVLAGCNSAGKSSVMQPLLLIKQTLDANSKAPLLQGDNVDLPPFEQIKTRVREWHNDFFSLRIQAGNFSAQSFFTGNEDEPIKLDSTKYSFPNSQTGHIGETSITLSDQTPEEELRRWMFQVYGGLEIVAKDGSFQPHAEACFHGIALRQSENRTPSISPIFRPSDLVTSDIQGIIHLPGLRGKPQRYDRKFSLEQHPFYRETFSQYTASIIALWERQKNGKYRALLDCLFNMRLATTVEAKTGSDWIELMVSRLLPRQSVDSQIDDNDLVSIADVGFGVSQVLPIITALIVAEKNQIVYVEQPETHLHPYANIGLVKAIMNAAHRGVKVVVETHSATFLLALQTMVASGHPLPHDQIALYWFSQKENGETHVNPGEMQENGTFGDWAVDFSDVTMDLQLEFMKALEKHLRREE